MRIALTVVAALIATFLLASLAIAQVPTATGRQISMSNAAWKVFIPSNYYPRAGNVADLIFHFHGDPQTYWNNVKYANLNAIVVTVNYNGLSSAYSTPFSNAALFQSIVDEALTKVRAQPDISDALQWDQVAVSSFSAGYGAVREILKSSTYRNEIDALLTADSLYATTAADGTPLDSQMVDYKTFASLAESGSKTFLFSHSQVPTYTYETTQECGDELMQHLGISAIAYTVNGLGTLSFFRHAKSGNFELWGATGTDGDSHLEHLRYIGEFLQHLPLAKVPIAGDYNADGKVDAADYTVWRDTFGSTTDLRANGDTTGGGALAVNTADFNVWKANYGHTQAGSGAATAVPEPENRLTGLFMAVAAGLLTPGSLTNRKNA